MKLFILSQYYFPEMGAAASRLFELSQGLKKHGWEIKVLSAMPNYPTGKIIKKYKRKIYITEHVEDIEVHRYWLYASNSNKVFPRLISMISFALSVLFSLNILRKEKPDYLLVESPPLLLGLSGLILSKLTNAKFILNVADIWPLSALELGAIKKGFIYKKIQQFEKYIYRKADICLGQSDEIVNHLKNNGSSVALLFRNGVDFKRFENVTNGKPNERFRIVYAGLIGVAQGILNICKNIEFSDNSLELHIYGDGAEKKKLSSYLEGNPDKNIFLHKPVNREEIPELLAHYDGTLIPLVKNLYGAVPSKIYEAMAAGLPIFFSGNGEGASIIKKYDVGWVSVSGDMNALKLNFDEFINFSDRRKELTNNGINAARDVFDRRIQINRLHNYLTEEIDS